MSSSDGKTLFRQFFIASLLLSIWANVVAASEEKITIKGSNTFGEELAPALIEQFQKDIPALKSSSSRREAKAGLQRFWTGNAISQILLEILAKMSAV